MSVNEEFETNTIAKDFREKLAFLVEELKNNINNTQNSDTYSYFRNSSTNSNFSNDENLKNTFQLMQEITNLKRENGKILEETESLRKENEKILSNIKNLEKEITAIKRYKKLYLNFKIFKEIIIAILIVCVFFIFFYIHFNIFNATLKNIFDTIDLMEKTQEIKNNLLRLIINIICLILPLGLIWKIISSLPKFFKELKKIIKYWNN